VVQQLPEGVTHFLPIEPQLQKVVSRDRQLLQREALTAADDFLQSLPAAAGIKHIRSGGSAPGDFHTLIGEQPLPFKAVGGRVPEGDSRPSPAAADFTVAEPQFPQKIPG